MRDRFSHPAFPLLLLAGALALPLATTSVADAAVTSYVVTLNGANESPPVASTGIGAGQVDIDTDANTLRIQVTWSGLVGPTTVAHIHAPTASPLSGTVGVAVTPGTLPGFPAGVTFGSYDVTLDTSNPAIYTSGFLTNFGGGSVGAAEAALAQFFADGKAYLNIHTSFAAGGEIRGFLVPAGATQSPATTWGKIKALYR
jgi:hypothetical protein